MRALKSPQPEISEEVKRRRFFYAMQEAEIYDKTIGWVCPYYDLLHKMLVQLIEKHILERNPNVAKNPYYILDIGCGTGAESLSLLNRFPFISVVGVDLAGPMLDQLKGKMEKLHIESNRFVPVRADFLTDACLPSEMRRRLPKEAGKRGFDAVISAFTLHHFTARQKSFAYRRVCECLMRDGVFLNGDLFNYERESSEMSTAALKFEVDWIREHFTEAAQRDPESGPRMMKLSKKWVAHYKYDNSCHSITTQLNMLHAAGFRQRANPFRYWQVGLLWGLK